jgi:hypothetical protein
MSAAIVDTNFLKEPDLYTALSAGAHVVMTDRVLHEALRAKTAAQAREEFRILATFPEQVLFAKPLGEILGTRIFYQRQLIDRAATAGFQQTLQNIDRGSDQTWQEIADAALQRAREELAMFEKGHVDIVPSLQSMRAAWSKEDLRVLHSGGTISAAATWRCLTAAFALARALLAHRNDPTAARAPAETLLDRMVFRFAVCHVAWSVERMREGLTKELKQPVARNDMVDRIVCAYATYFGDFYSLDQRPGQMHSDARQLIRAATLHLRRGMETNPRYQFGEVPH